jgi:hypothetical protein
MDFMITKRGLEKEIKEIHQNYPKQALANSRVITFCSEILDDYRKKIRAVPFADTIAEIKFFKEQKQIPLVYLIYYSNLQSFLLKAPKVGKKQRRRFINTEIDKLNAFFISKEDFVHYIALEQTYMDSYYFTRGSEKMFHSLDAIHYCRDTEFNTPGDLLHGEIKAYQRYLIFLQDQLKTTEELYGQFSEKQMTLHWRLSKVDLIELIYAIYYSGAIHPENLSLKDFMVGVQKLTGIQLEDYPHTFLRLRGRKQPLKFLNIMQENLLKRMNELNA